MSKELKSTEYLYDLNPKKLAKLTYKKAIKLKIKQCSKIIDELHIPDYRSRDEERIDAVFKARKFNEALLKELRTS